MKIEFDKYSGSGNDFVILDGRKVKIATTRLSATAKVLCDRRSGVGADGLLMMKPQGKKAVRMLYFNADGSRASLCGNGARCISHFAVRSGAVDSSFYLYSDAGIHEANVNGSRVDVELVNPKLVRKNLILKVKGREFKGHLVLVGVPHLVVKVPSVRQFDLDHWGPLLRRHRKLGREGANVNIFESRIRGRIRMRTFERGVEGETLACGTGAASAAWVSMGMKNLTRKVMVRVSGGEDLTLRFEPGEVSPRVFLAGRIHRVFSGIWEG